MKNIYHFLFLLMALSFLTQAALGQSTGTLSGLVVDDKGAPLSYGTVALLKSTDQSLQAGAAIELDGTFRLKAPVTGSYFLRISALGFAPQNLPAFEVTSPAFTKVFGKVTLLPDAKLLKEVTVQGLRPSIDVQADKMVVSVEGTAMAAGSTVYDVLAKSPGVWVDQDGNLQLNGKAGVQVMLDGKPTYLSGKQLQTMLQGMPAENLKNLEIIANPSAKHDAEGTAGILNINLKKNTLTGLNGSVYGGYQFNPKHALNGGATVNLKQGKWSSFATADLAYRPRKRTFSMDRTFQDGENTYGLLMRGQEEGVSTSPSLRLGTDYDFTKNQSVGASLQLNQSVSDNLVSTATQLDQNQIKTANNTDSRYRSVTMNVHYLAKLDTLGATLSSDLDVAQIRESNTGLFQTQNGTLQTNLENVNPTSYQIYSAKVDYTLPLASLKGKVETGAKASYVRSDNQIDFYKGQGAERSPDLERKADHFIFDENIYAGYLSVNSKLSAKWTLQAGLRAEYTSSKGNSLPNKLVTPRHYVDWFPSVFVQQKITDNYQISYNYSRRINRPRYQSLNPFVFFIDSNTEVQGNPYLKPQYTHSFQITQTIKKNYNVIMGYTQSKDAMSEVPVPNAETRKIVFQQRNVAFKNLNATLVAPITVTSKWNFNNNLSLAYQKYTTTIDQQTVRNSQVMYMAQTNHNVLLPKSFKLEVSGGYQSDAVFNIYRIKSSYWVDLGVKKSFLNDQLDVTITGTDLFKTRRMQGVSTLNGNTNALDMYRYSQSVRLQLRYRFTKGEKFEVKHRNTSLEELNRAGGN